MLRIFFSRYSSSLSAFEGVNKTNLISFIPSITQLGTIGIFD